MEKGSYASLHEAGKIPEVGESLGGSLETELNRRVLYFFFLVQRRSMYTGVKLAEFFLVQRRSMYTGLKLAEFFDLFEC